MEHVSVGELLDRAEDGDPAAKAALDDFGAETSAIMERFSAASRAITADWADRVARPAIDPTALDDVGESIAADKRGAIEREEAMLREMVAMRDAGERAEARAKAAEGREGEAVDLARRTYRVAVAAIIVAVAIAALSIAATVLVAVFT